MPLKQSDLNKLVYSLECLPGFPRTEAGLIACTKAIRDLVGDDLERAQWLIDATLKGAPRFPAPIEMRRIYATKYAPYDGLRDFEADMSDHFPGRAPIREG